jgi:CO/xanthine dehydrogenase FAD-binding subunit
MSDDINGDRVTQQRRERVRAIAEKRREDMQRVTEDFAASSRRKQEAVRNIYDDALRQAVGS